MRFLLRFHRIYHSLSLLEQFDAVDVAYVFAACFSGSSKREEVIPKLGKYWSRNS